MRAWAAREVQEITGGSLRGSWVARGIFDDIAKLQVGGLFVDRDGDPDMVQEAYKKGALAVLSEHLPEAAPGVIVRKVKDALTGLAAETRRKTAARVVALAGSVGKSSTKYMLATALDRQGWVHVAGAGAGRPEGVALTLANIPDEARFVVVELDTQGPGDMARLTDLARPDVAVALAVGEMHMSVFEGLGAIGAEVARVLDGAAMAAIFNADSVASERFRARAEADQVLGFGTNPGAQVHLAEVQVTDQATIAVIHVGGVRQLVRLDTLGEHFAMNATAVLATAHALGADVTLAARDLSLWQPPEGRGTCETICLDPFDDINLTLIDDAMNAIPASMRASLEVLAATHPTDGLGRVARGRRIACLGDMEAVSEARHAGLAAAAAVEQIDVIHCIGPAMRALWEALSPEKRGAYCESADSFAARIRHHVDGGDVLLVKGAPAVGLNRVVDAVRKLGHPQLT